MIFSVKKKADGLSSPRGAKATGGRLCKRRRKEMTRWLQAAVPESSCGWEHLGSRWEILNRCCRRADCKEGVLAGTGVLFVTLRLLEHQPSRPLAPLFTAEIHDGWKREATGLLDACLQTMSHSEASRRRFLDAGSSDWPSWRTTCKSMAMVSRRKVEASDLLCLIWLGRER